MRKLGVVLVCCCLTMLSSGSEPLPLTAASLVGLWRLVRIEVRQPDGSITADPDLGPHPVGYIFYDSSGHMGVQIMNPDRPRWKSDNEPSPDEAKLSIAGYDAYSGTYEVHPKEGYVVHHSEISLDPNGVGEDRKRKFEMSGNQLRLTPPPFKTVNGVLVDETLIWERVR